MADQKKPVNTHDPAPVIRSDPELAVLRPILAGHDAGTYSLPESLLAAREAVTQVTAGLAKVRADIAATNPARARSAAVAAVVEAAGRGEAPGNAAGPFMAAQDELRRLAAEEAVLLAAKDAATQRLPATARKLAEEILTEHLRPALEAVLERVRVGAGVAPAVPWGDSRKLAQSSKEARAYHEVVAQAADDYAVIRRAQAQLVILSNRPGREAFDLFGELRNLRQLWPLRGGWQESGPPWPTDPRERMVWLVTSEAEPWLPTPKEAQQAYDQLVAAHAPLSGIGRGQGFVGVQGGRGLNRMRG